jgi:DNA-binding HxlR family transcriptional regulator
MLPQTLRSMERNGVVSRTVYATTPPSVEYALLPLRTSVSKISEQMCVWVQDHIKEVILARQAYDKGLEGPAGVSKVVGGQRTH